MGVALRSGHVLRKVVAFGEILFSNKGVISVNSLTLDNAVASFNV